jgi:hypothetical protein
MTAPASGDCRACGKRPARDAGGRCSKCVVAGKYPAREAVGAQEMDRRIRALGDRVRAAHADPTVRVRRITPMEEKPMLERVADWLQANGPATATEVANAVGTSRASAAGMLRDLADETPPRAHRAGKLGTGSGRPSTVWKFGPVVGDPAEPLADQEITDAVAAGAAEVEVVSDPDEIRRQLHAAADEIAAAGYTAGETTTTLHTDPLPLQPALDYIRTPLRERYADALLDLVAELKGTCPDHVFDRLERLCEAA